MLKLPSFLFLSSLFLGLFEKMEITNKNPGDEGGSKRLQNKRETN